MSYSGTVKGNLIELDERPPFPEGSRVQVTLTRETVPRRGSPTAVLKLAGTLTHEEAELIRKGAAEIRRIDPGLWGNGTQ
ncbi:MAG: hypothetical protein FJ291_05230 [Planctomycetes bacterium]|nr:hypothetical protein [Planctomycetota bacterium]